MSEPQDSSYPANKLTAFADGDLNPARSADVLEYLSSHPEAARTIARQMRFRGAVGRSVRGLTPPPGEALRERITAMVARDAALTVRRQLPVWRQRSQFWFGAVAAALFFVALGLSFGKMIYGVAGLSDDIVPAPLVSAVTHVHVDCSRAPSLHHLPFPHELGDLKDALQADLGRDEPYPDLSAMGYQYVGAGPCSKPMEGTVHLLYQSTNSPVVDTMSLFVQKFHGQLNIADGKIYWAQDKTAAHPMLVWRRGSLVYYLVGDADGPVMNAAKFMHVRPPV